MSTKLTARLSDGTEWEVVERCDTPFDIKTNTILDGYDRMLLKPLKPSPPKELWVAVENATGLFGGTRLTDIGKNLNPDYTNFRYVLAEEPKAKPQPREWWDVRCILNDKVLCSYDNYGEALGLLVRENGIAGRTEFEIVHVREVLDG
jgi:hypothetical protein